jgi:hypothetical protein
MSDEGLSKCGELEAERDIARQENERLRALLRQIKHNMDRYAKDTRMNVRDYRGLAQGTCDRIIEILDKQSQ